MFSSVQFIRRVQLFGTPRTAACQASQSITNSQGLLKLMSIELVMPSNHLILCHPLLLLPSIFPSIRVSSSESVLCMRWPEFWSFSPLSHECGMKVAMGGSCTMGQAGRLAATLYLQGLCIFSGDTEGVSSLWHSRGLVVRFGPESPPMGSHTGPSGPILVTATWPH